MIVQTQPLGMKNPQGVDMHAFILTVMPDGHWNTERVILFTLEAWDVNCQQHIHERYSRRQIAPVIEKLHARIAELEAELNRLKASLTT